MSSDILIRSLKRWDYRECLEAMRSFTAGRTERTQDEIWLVEHPPVFTQGLAGKSEHVLNAGKIEVVDTERGGQVTYHGPGQILAYTLLDLRRRNITVRDLVCRLESGTMNYLSSVDIASTTKTQAPGVYLRAADGAPGAKIAALGLKISKGCSFHGIALNVEMDLAPFSCIHPCGYADLEVTSIKEVSRRTINLSDVGNAFASALIKELTRTNDTNTKAIR